MTYNAFTLDPSDYTSISETLAFSSGTFEGGMGSTQCVNISITDNLAFEKTESFFVIISSEPEVYLPDPNVTVVIADDEGMSCWKLLRVEFH